MIENGKSPESPPDGYLIHKTPFITVAYACARAGCGRVVLAASAVVLADGERYCRECARRTETGLSRHDQQLSAKRDQRARARMTREPERGSLDWFRWRADLAREKARS